MGDLSSRPHFTASDGTDGSMHGLSIGYLNKMSTASCVGDKGCLWKRSKWTPTEVSIHSQDFTSWVKDVRSILDGSKGCPSFLFYFRFAMVSGTYVWGE